MGAILANVEARNAQMILTASSPMTQEPILPLTIKWELRGSGARETGRGVLLDVKIFFKEQKYKAICQQPLPLGNLVLNHSIHKDASAARI